VHRGTSFVCGRRLLLIKKTGREKIATSNRAKKHIFSYFETGWPDIWVCEKMSQNVAQFIFSSHLIHKKFIVLRSSLKFGILLSFWKDCQKQPPNRRKFAQSGHPAVKQAKTSQPRSLLVLVNVGGIQARVYRHIRNLEKPAMYLHTSLWATFKIY
jgi:hypothetical protein